MGLRAATATTLAALLLSGCTTLSQGGTVLGVAAPGKTTSLAFRADPAFGTELSRRDWRRLARAELRALDFVPGGKSASWGQPSGRARGSVEVSQPFSIASRECRRFRHAVVIRGRKQGLTGVACRTDQGPWSLVS